MKVFVVTLGLEYEGEDAETARVFYKRDGDGGADYFANACVDKWGRKYDYAVVSELEVE